MIFRNDFISRSLELNLFFLRIMKEHSFFLEAAFQPKDSRLAAEARRYRIEFERMLAEAVELANGNVSRDAINSEQFVTQYTDDAEEQTGLYTGVPFNLILTQREQRLTPGNGTGTDLERRVEALNRRAYRQTAMLAEFKETLYKKAGGCEIFTANYPSLIKHMLEEAHHYMEMLEQLPNMRAHNEQMKLSNEVFWNARMAEHAKTMAGLLDPAEEALIDAARMFGKEFDELTGEAKRALAGAADSSEVTRDSLEATERLRSFKLAGVEGILQCRIKSIILPLLAEHILREANHYLCGLGKCDMK